MVSICRIVLVWAVMTRGDEKETCCFGEECVGGDMVQRTERGEEMKNRR